MKTKKLRESTSEIISLLSLLGVCTIAVVLGQLYVGTGYRVLHGGVQELLNKVDGVLLRADDPDTPKFY